MQQCHVTPPPLAQISQCSLPFGLDLGLVVWVDYRPFEGKARRLTFRECNCQGPRPLRAFRAVMAVTLEDQTCPVFLGKEEEGPQWAPSGRRKTQRCELLVEEGEALDQCQ